MNSAHRLSEKTGKSKEPPFVIPSALKRLRVPIRSYKGRIENYQHVHPDLIDLLSGFKNGLEYSMVTSPYVGGDAI